MVTQQEIDGGVISGEKILKQRLAEEFWGLDENALNRRSLKKGDQIVFYLGMPEMSFAAFGTLASDFFALSGKDKEKYRRDKPFQADYGVLLENAQLWDVPRPVKDLVERLTFIQNKKNWFAHFRGSVRPIPPEDYRTIAEFPGVATVETKPIEIIDPRRVSISLSYTKKGDAYRVYASVRSFLEGRGWAVQKVGKSYATVTPPKGTSAPFNFEVEIPKREQIEAVAQALHVARKPWAGKFGEWIAFYIHPQGWSMTKFNIFTAEAMLEPTRSGMIDAHFLVGIRLFWNAEVHFRGEKATYYESDSQPVQVQANLFDGRMDSTTAEALVDARLGQGKFGAAVRQHWNHRCCVTGSSTQTALEASHIRAWADSNDAERLDPNNGLLLTANLHKLFDAGLITFEDSGRMRVSTKLSRPEQDILGVAPKRLSKKPSAEMAKYLAYHRTRFVK